MNIVNFFKARRTTHDVPKCDHFYIFYSGIRTMHDARRIEANEFYDFHIFNSGTHTMRDARRIESSDFHDSSYFHLRLYLRLHYGRLGRAKRNHELLQMAKALPVHASPWLIPCPAQKVNTRAPFGGRGA